MYNALAALASDMDQVLVHDGARPFLRATLVTRLLKELPGTDGVIPGLPVTDTIKEIGSGIVKHTPDRQNLWRMQTPQAFFFSSAAGRAQAGKSPKSAGDR